MSNIVIIGGGFGGIAAGLELHRCLGDRTDVIVTLVDKEAYHLFHANLYEVATSEEELTTISQLAESVAVPITKIFAATKAHFVKAAVASVDYRSHAVRLQSGGSLPYDYLVLASGSESNFFNIPGAKEHALPLKTLPDALRIRNAVEFAIERHRHDVHKKYVRIMVAGGGLAGVELAAELQGLLRLLAWKYGYPLGKIETLIIEGASSLLPRIDSRAAADAAARLQELGVRVQLESLICKVDSQFVEFANGERLDYDCLLWTAGVKACSEHCKGDCETDKGDHMMTDENLQLPGIPGVFCLGDQAMVADATGKPVPGTTTQARDQAVYVGQAIARLLEGKALEPYQPKEFGYSIPLGGKWAIAHTGRLYLKGYFGYLGRQWEIFKYFASLLGWWDGLRLLLFSSKLYKRNNL
jgi:NADH:ubiquinone reductase (H+-translocating)